MCVFFCSSQVSDYSYRAAVRELIPQLRYLDDVQVEEEDRQCNSCTMGDDWAVLRHSIRDPNLPRADTDEGACGSSVDYRWVLKKINNSNKKKNFFVFIEKTPQDTAASARLATPSHSLVRLSSASRPHTCSTPMTATTPGVLSPSGSRPGSAGPHLATFAVETSSLTHG